jgi:uncharacterized membrane protein YphA (DoxX/SURF4 family)
MEPVSLESRSVPRPAWKRHLGTSAGVFLGLVLLVAAWGKILDPERFVEQIRFEGLDFFGLGWEVALCALFLEVAQGLALVLGLRRGWVLWPTSGLVLFFLFLTGRSYWRFSQGLIDESESCGCFGNLVSRTPAEAFWQDLILLAIPLALAYLGRSAAERPVRGRLAVVAGVTLAALALTVMAPRLPLDDLATRLRPGAGISELCAGAEGSAERICLDAVITELDRGRHLVILTGLDEESFLEALPALNELSLGGGDVRVWAVTDAAEDVVDTFAWTSAPAFDVREAPEALLRPLYRRRPRTFVVQDGRVEETWPGVEAEAR